MSKLVFANLDKPIYFFSIIEPRSIQGGMGKKHNVKTLLISNFRSERWDPMNKEIIKEMKRLNIRIAKIIWFKKKVRIREIITK